MAYPVLEIDQGKIVDTNGAGDAFVGGKFCVCAVMINLVIRFPISSTALIESRSPHNSFCEMGSLAA